MVYTFARVGAMIAMTLEDYYSQGKRSWLRLHEKSGKQHGMPAHHTLEQYLDEYLKAAGMEGNRKGPLFRTAPGITCYLGNKRTLEKAQAIAYHSSPRTTMLYDRTSDQITLDEVEKIVLA